MKVYFVSLGCDKNSVDSEVMLSVLSKNGYEMTDDEMEADVAVVNTCCFIGDAKEESINTIIELGSLKEEGNLKALVIAGCLGQRYQEEIHKELPEVDAIVGTNAIDDIAEVVKSVLVNKSKDSIRALNEKPVAGHNRMITTGGHYEYLKIAEGCDKHCTYCVIPSVRGPYRSIPMEVLVKEAESLVASGVKELILVAQEITVYGLDLYGEKKLPELIKELAKIEDLGWIRLLYCYPEEITDELIEVIKNEPKVVNYIDMPIQSGSDRILKLMGRKTTHEDILNIINKLRKNIPGICIRTTLITGFPTETSEDHEESVRLVNEARFGRLGVFTYSAEENTPAGNMDGQIDEECKEERKEELMLIQQDIAFENAESMIGSKVKAFVMGYIREDDIYACRTYMDAPDVDGYLFVTSHRELISGELIDVLITDSNEYDLIGEYIPE